MKGFYAVLDRDDPALAVDLAAHACALQIRIKDAPADAQVRLARAVHPICRAAGIPLIINDRLDVALAAGADGVHLGQTDLPLVEARRVAAGRLLIGVSTHDVAQVRAACAGGADYLGFGPIFATRTKANPDPVQGIAGLRAAVAAAGRTPIVAIGGVTPGAVREIYGAGAAAVCAISAVNEAASIRAVARELAL